MLQLAAPAPQRLPIPSDPAIATSIIPYSIRSCFLLFSHGCRCAGPHACCYVCLPPPPIPSHPPPLQVSAALADMPGGSSLHFLMRLMEQECGQRYAGQLERLERENARLANELAAEKSAKEEYRRVNERMWTLMRCGRRQRDRPLYGNLMR